MKSLNSKDKASISYAVIQCLILILTVILSVTISFAVYSFLRWEARAFIVFISILFIGAILFIGLIILEEDCDGPLTKYLTDYFEKKSASKANPQPEAWRKE